MGSFLAPFFYSKFGYFKNYTYLWYMKRKDIKDGNLVYDGGRNMFYIIQDVGNARSKGDREHSSTSDDELSYTILNVLTESKQKGICECSHMTSETLQIATERDVDLYFAFLESETTMDLAIAMKKQNEVLSSINRFNKFKENDKKSD